MRHRVRDIILVSSLYDSFILAEDGLAPSEIKAAPQLGSVVDSTYLAGLATQDERMILLLDIEKFLSSNELNLLARVAEGVPEAK